MEVNFKNLLRSTLILALIALVGCMMVGVNHLQGTAQVVNCAGLVRGATQRLVKLELSGIEYLDLENDLDRLLDSLAKGGGSFELPRLSDATYQERLEVQTTFWKKLQTELDIVRREGTEKSDLLHLSELYFHMADTTVNAAVDYSERLARNLRRMEWGACFVMVGLLLLLISDAVQIMRMRRENRLLLKKAYIDLHTGLLNKSRCEELLRNNDPLDQRTACVLFDLNNLKEVNDRLGHSTGDLMIQNFARELRHAVPPQHLVARYGGDEFLVVIKDVSEADLHAMLYRVRQAFEHYNSVVRHLPISYAYGWAHSAHYGHCTLRMLFDRADKAMYENKSYWHHRRA